MRIGDSTIMSPELAQYLDVFMASSQQRLREVQAEKDQLQVRGSIFTDLNVKLLKLRRLATDLSQTSGLSEFKVKTVSVSDESVLSATVSSGATALNHSIHVEQLARAHSVISNRYDSSATDLSSSFAGTKNFTVTVDGTDYDVAVEIAAGATNEEVLDAVSQAINGTTDIAARATRVSDTDSTSKLSITSTETGTANVMSFTDTDGLLAALGVTNAAAATDLTGGYVHADLGGGELDAKFTLNGISVVRSTNTLDDVLPGVTLQIHSAQESGDPDVSVGVELDGEAVREKLQEFLDAYNEVASYLSSKVNVDPDTFARGELAGDFNYSSLLTNMRVAMAGSVSTAEDPLISALSQIGITSSRSGTFSIDADKFDEAIAGNLEAVESLFNSEDGIAIQLMDLVKRYTGGDGIITNSKDGIESRKDFIDTRIERMEALMEQEEDQLIAQFAAMQEASIMQQSLQTVLNSINGFI